MGLTYQFPRGRIVEAIQKCLTHYEKEEAVCAVIGETCRAVIEGVKKIAALDAEEPDIENLLAVMRLNGDHARKQSATVFRLRKALEHLSTDPIVTLDHETAIMLGLFDPPEEDKGQAGT